MTNDKLRFQDPIEDEDFLSVALVVASLLLGISTVISTLLLL